VGGEVKAPGPGGEVKFSPGVQPANPKRNGHAAAQHFMALIRANTPDEDVIAVWKAVMDAARDGDMKAADIVLERLAGKVPQAMEHSGPEGGGIVIQYALAQKPADG
jgi:hypothetical protein